MFFQFGAKIHFGVDPFGPKPLLYPETAVLFGQPGTNFLQAFR